MEAGHAEGGRAIESAAGEPDRRRSRAAGHLDLAPRPAQPRGDAQRLDDALLRGESGREVARRPAAAAGVPDLLLRKDAAHEAVASPLDRPLDAIDLDDVDPDPDDASGVRAHAARS